MFITAATFQPARQNASGKNPSKGKSWRCSHRFSSTTKEKSYLQTKIAQIRQGWGKEREAQINALNLTLSQLRNRLIRFTDAFVDRLIEKEIFEERKSVLLMEKAGLEEKLDELRDESSSLLEKVRKFLELAGNAYSAYKSARFAEQKQDLLKTITSNRLVDGKNLEISLHLPFREVANRFQNSNGGPEGI